MSSAAWDHPSVLDAWKRFEARHDRYHLANASLASEAELEPSMSVLDVGAGTGGTTAALLPHLGPRAQVLCLEPAGAMREAGLQDPRVVWTDTWPERSFDRVVCGAAVWLLGPLEQGLARLASHVAPGGALVFDIPAAYLGQPDPPGPQNDAWLTELPSRLVQGRAHAPTTRATLPGPQEVEDLLRAAGLAPRRWQVQTTWSNRALADWYRLPPVGLAMRPDLDAESLHEAVAQALSGLDPADHRPEPWLGWTARRPSP